MLYFKSFCVACATVLVIGLIIWACISVKYFGLGVGAFVDFMVLWWGIHSFIHGSEF